MAHPEAHMAAQAPLRRRSTLVPVRDPMKGFNNLQDARFCRIDQDMIPEEAFSNADTITAHSTLFQNT